MATTPETRSREFLVPSSSRRTEQDNAEPSRATSAIRRLPSHGKIGRAASASATVITSSPTSSSSRNTNHLALKPKDNLRRVASNVMHGPRPPPPKRSPQTKSTFNNENSSPSSLHKARSSPHLTSLDLPRAEAGPSNSARKQDFGSLSKHLVSASMSSSSVDKPGNTSGSRLRHRTTASSLTSHTSQSSQRKGSNANLQRSDNNSPTQKNQTLALSVKDVKPSPKSSGNASDSSFSRRSATHPLDMKRLLSKPAPQSASPHSATSAPEWDLLRRPSLSVERDTVSTALRRDRSRGSRDRGELNLTPSHSVGLKSSNSLLPFPSATSPTSSREHGRNGFSDNKSDASHGVHQRRASDVTEMQVFDRVDKKLPISPASKSKLLRRPSTANDIDPRPPPGLTPAGAVAHAYKVQEQRRKTNEDQEDPSARKSSKNGRRATSAGANVVGDEEDSDSHAPYYTVLGGTTGRTVAIGSALDSVWDHYLSDVSGHRGPPAASRLRRNVSRKVSGKWKKKDDDGGDKPGGVMDDMFGTEKSQDDMNNKFSGLVKDGRAVLKLSMDGIGFTENGIKSSKSLSAEKPWTTTKAAFDLETAWKIEKGEDTYGDRVKAKKKSIVDDSSAAGKLWKLVKKLSSGTLKDHHRHQQPSDVPPPVPSLPKEVLQSKQLPQPQSASPDINPDLNTSRRSSSRTSRPRPSLSLRPSTAPSPTRRRPSIPFITPTMTPNQDQTRNVSTSSGAKNSTATASSSPVSSQSQLFNRAHSPQSSTSSYGEEFPPSIHANLKKQEQDPSRTDKFWKSIPMLPPILTDNTIRLDLTEEEDMPALFQDKQDAGSPPDSPTIPTFSTEHSVNSFPPRRPSADHSSRLPEQLRNISISDSSAQSHIISTPRKMSNSSFMSDFEDLGQNNIIFPELSKSNKLNGHDTPTRKRSISQGRDSLFGTPRRSTAGSPTSMDTVTASPMVFRGINESRQAWTEQEKVDKWDDLLLRSAKAGGTLHVGLEKLMSDDISLSSF